MITNSQAVLTVSLEKLSSLSSPPHLQKKRVSLSTGSPRVCIFLTISLHAMHGLIATDYNMPHAALNTSHTLSCIFTSHNYPKSYMLLLLYIFLSSSSSGLCLPNCEFYEDRNLVVFCSLPSIYQSA